MISAIRVWLDVVLPFWRIAAALAAVAALAGVAWWVRDTGVQAERARWQIKMSASDAHWQAQLDAANASNRSLERRSAQSLANVSTRYQREIKNVDAKKNYDRSSVQRGSLRLFDRPDDVTRQNDCRALSATSDPTASTLGCDGREATELSGATTENLFDLVNDADAVVAQLSAAQSVILEYQKLCGAGGGL